MPHVNFKWEVNITTIVTLVTLLCSLIWFAAGQDKTNAIQDTKIAANERYISRGLAEERQLTKDAVEDIKQQIAVDRQEWRRQFEKVNEKLDKIVDRGLN